jgi:hypothetical protein
MRRRLRSIGKWVSTVLAIGLLALMVVGKWWNVIGVYTLASGGIAHIIAGSGIVLVGCRTENPGMPEGWSSDKSYEWTWAWGDPPPGGMHMLCGFFYIYRPGKSAVAGMTMLYPVLAATAGAALLWRADIKARRRERAMANACASCGYDRRGLAGDVKCPECSTVPTPPRA